MGITKKSKHKQPDQKYCQYNRINIWLQKGLPDSVGEMYIAFACLVGLIEYVLKSLEMQKSGSLPLVSFAVRHLGRYDPSPKSMIRRTIKTVFLFGHEPHDLNKPTATLTHIHINKL